MGLLYVFLQTGPECEFLVALVNLTGKLSSLDYPLVRLRVLLQVALSDKLFGARLALKGLFVRVNFLVPDQVGALCEF